MSERNLIGIVWESGTVLTGLDPAMWRKDAFGNLIRRDQFGHRTAHGWEIDRGPQKDADGRVTLQSARPLHWRTYHSKASLRTAA